MKNYYRFFCLLFCIVLSSTCLAKRSSEYIVLAVGTSFSYRFDQTVKWRITELAGGKVLKNGFGPIRKLVFEIPGAYQIDVEEELNYDPATCNHPQYPNEITIEVSPYRMEFDFATVRLSDEIAGGQPADGRTLSVDVNFSVYGKDTVVYEVPPVRTAGAGTSITGLPIDKQILLKPGVNTFVYLLSGQVHSNSYIMFDFLDINNQVQVYSLPQKIK
ncbi:hypothetical protein [Parapedobacter indicus]|uniref:Uncharacterized protein n=1 Tax=Parapedobacter indicus TaxID=1477437 RepID=A0A1I3CQ02_9SPHI|nr:hypothetical protein [Parapedobacter indicus]PPL04347.1 hypothetical protein CLV26_101148 [Parapedobacter indicus]SFH76567.1 hypothetical protein SAMN05444682_101135 [Parapedobacter indicus]